MAHSNCQSFGCSYPAGECEGNCLHTNTHRVAPAASSKYASRPLPVDVAEPDPDSDGDMQMLAYTLVLLFAVIFAGVWWWFA